MPILVRVADPQCSPPSTPSIPSPAAKATKAVTEAPKDVSFVQQLDGKLALLQSRKEAWRALPLRDKIDLLKKVQHRLLRRMHAWGRISAEISNQPYDKMLRAGFTFAPLIMVNVYIKALISTLTALDKTGKCPEVPTRTTASGQIVAHIQDGSDPNTHCKADLYIQPGKPATQGRIYLDKQEGGKLTVVLGAGNFGFIGLTAPLVVLFEYNNLVLFKPHPLQARWQEIADDILEPLTAAGFYQSIYPPTDEDAQSMLYHPSVEAVQMTGGTATHDKIVWGSTPEEQQRRKAANDPLLKVPITSELGCVTPWIVTPGDWTDKQLDTQAADAAWALWLNNGCLCNSLKVLVLPQSWPQADVFLSKIKKVMADLPVQPSFYPGHKERYSAWHAQFPAAEVIQGVTPGGANQDLLLPYLIHEVAFPEPGAALTPQQKYAFTVEPFAPVLTVVRVPAATPVDFMRKATQFANDTVWGSLSCSVLLHPDMEQQYPNEVQQMLDDLRFGAVSVNAWSGVPLSCPHVPWGAFVGDQTLADVGSGIGCINNTLLFDYPQRVVARIKLCDSTVPKPFQVMGIPSWLYAPLAGLMVGGLRGLLHAVFSRA